MRCASVGRRRQERRRDLLRGQAADLAQRERHLRVGRERRVAAGEDQAQPVVLDALRLEERRVLCARVVRVEVQRLEARLPAELVDGLEATRGHEPCARVRRHAVARPLLERRAEGLVQRLLGQGEIAEQADQGGEHGAGLGAIHRVDGRARLRLRLGIHGAARFAALERESIRFSVIAAHPAGQIGHRVEPRPRQARPHDRQSSTSISRTSPAPTGGRPKPTFDT